MNYNTFKLIRKMQDAEKLNEMMMKFVLMKTDEMRIEIILTVMKMFDHVPKANCKVKDSKESIRLRNEANKIFISSNNNVKELFKVCELYSKSIAMAPKVSQELSLAYANRSAVLMQVRKYDECIEDINRALELDYPNHLKGKLLVRKIKCLKFKNNIVNVEDIVEEARCWLQNIKLCEAEKQKIKENLKSVASLSSEASIFESDEIQDLPIFIPHKEIPCVSEALTFKYNTKFGRHFVTNRTVETGEILILEKPYSKILDPKYAHTHCSHCLLNHWAMIPCEFCINVMYCSQKCKNEAWNQSHDVECNVTGYLLDLDYHRCSLLSMRLAILALKEAGSINQLRKNLEKINNSKESHNNSFADELVRSDKYGSVYCLLTHAEKRSQIDLFERALNAAFSLYYLCSITTLFGRSFNYDLEEMILDKDLTYIGGLILRHMQIIPINSHSFNEELEHENKTLAIGALLEPVSSLLTHSCNPNVNKCSSKEYLIIFAHSPIEKGSQILYNYGTHFATMNKLMRQEKLSYQYYFKCECQACNENWPTLEHLLSYEKLVTNKEIKRKVNKALDKFTMYNFVIFSYMSVAENNITNKQQALADLKKMIDVMSKYVPLPCVEFLQVVETYQRVFNLTYGNKFVMPKLN